MKKIVSLSIRHVEKLVLAICMSILIVTLSFQLQSLSFIRGNIETVMKEAEKIDDFTLGRAVPTIEQSELDLSIDAEELWKPNPTLGAWAKYRIPGPAGIFTEYLEPPETLSENYQAYLRTYGPGSLFDPPLYVRPLSGAPKLLTFESTHDYESPHAFDLPRKIVVPPKRRRHGPKIPSLPKTPPGALVRLVRTESPNLPFIFKSAMGEHAMFQIGKRQKPIAQGATIAGGYTFIKVESEEVEWKTINTAIVKDAEGNEIRLPINKTVAHPHKKAYVLIYFPRIKKLFSKQAGDVFRLTYAGQTTEYSMEVIGEQVSLVERVNGNPTDKKAIMVTPYDPEEYTKWAREVRAILEANRNPTDSP